VPGTGTKILRIKEEEEEFSKYYRTDPGSEIRDPGVKKAPDPGSGSATLLCRIPVLRVQIRNSVVF
jgi:hypothetical protein